MERYDYPHTVTIKGYGTTTINKRARANIAHFAPLLEQHDEFVLMRAEMPEPPHRILSVYRGIDVDCEFMAQYTVNADDTLTHAATGEAFADLEDALAPYRTNSYRKEKSMLHTQRTEKDRRISVRLADEPFVEGEYTAAYEVAVAVPFDISDDGRACEPMVHVHLLSPWRSPTPEMVRRYAADLMVVAEEAERLQAEARARFAAWQAEVATRTEAQHVTVEK